MSAILRIDLDAFAANLAEIRRRVAPAEHMLVVKDDAYGHGLEEIARRAWDEGVRWFGAFDVRTARHVRVELGDDARVFVWIVAPRESAHAIGMDLDIGIGDADLLEEVAAAASSSGRRARVHLKVDTGLHRNGVRPEDWPAFVARAAELERADAVHVVGVWSHIAEASDAADDDARAAFDAAIGHARSAGLDPAVRHLAASAAAFARPEFRYDLVRVGAFAYGIRPAGGPDEASLGIRPVARLDATVEAVGAGTVTISAGALDGVPSILGGRSHVGTAAGARRLLEVGDSASVVAAWDAAAPGDVVSIFGPGDDGEPSPTGVAEAIGTIGEEIAVRVSATVPRTVR